LLSLIAELGGYMSLFLGISCMNLYSFFAYIFTNTPLIFRVKRSNSEKVVNMRICAKDEIK